MSVKRRILSDLSDNVKQPQSSNEEPPNQFDTLHDDCINEILKWLPTEDLVSVNLTCKRLWKITNQHYHNERGIKEFCLHGTYIFHSTRPKYPPSAHFYNHTQNIKVQNDLQFLRDYLKKINENIYKITFEDANINEADCEAFGKSLAKVKIVVINSSTFRDKLHESLLRHCISMKYLVIEKSRMDNEWLSKKYPTLQQLVWNGDLSTELGEFFEQNQNIETFSSWRNIITVTDWLLKSNCTFHNLVLVILKCSSNNEFDQIIANVNLYKNQLEFIAKELTELEELHIGTYTIWGFFPFITFSPNLQSLYINSTVNFSTYWKGSTELWNQKRSKLNNACKLTIYMDESNYLEMKWTSSINTK